MQGHQEIPIYMQTNIHTTPTPNFTKIQLHVIQYLKHSMEPNICPQNEH